MTIPTCPFCWATLNYPIEFSLNEVETILGGHCFLCGALFIVDVTGKNVGEAVVQGLGIIAQELGKDLEMLESGRDYEDCVLGYDAKRHQILGPGSKFYDGNARLYVIRTLKEGKPPLLSARCN